LFGVSRARRHLVAVCLALSGLALGRPAHAEEDWWGRDKALHFGVGVAIGGGGYALAVPFLDASWQRAAVGGAAVLGAGLAKEGWDALGHGDPSTADLAWDLAGGAVGVGLALAVDLLVRGPRPRSSPPRSARLWSGAAPGLQPGLAR